MSRHYRFLVIPGVSLAADVEGGIARIAVTLCDEQDHFSRATARIILDHLLDSDNITLNALRLTRNVFSMPFRGKRKAGKELMQPLIEFLVDRLNERTLYRGLRKLFLDGITSKEEAQAAAKDAQSEAPFKRFSRLTNVLEKEEKEIFSQIGTLEDFEDLFFDWAGSADSVVAGVAQFAFQAQLRDIEESADRLVKAMEKETPAPSTDNDETRRIPKVDVKKTEQEKVEQEKMEAVPPPLPEPEPAKS